MSLPFFISIPHSGERVAQETPWLKTLPEPVLMCDPDRYVDRLYQKALRENELPHVMADWHRYVVDLNRLPGDIDEDSVVGAPNPSGTHPKGLHWSVTTKGDRLIEQPMPMDLHHQLVAKYYRPFHEQVEKMYSDFFQGGHAVVYQLDAHSMPSVGEKLHRDPGEQRAEVVISDSLGKSCSEDYTHLVIAAFRDAGFEVAHNWPYVGGRITEHYGRPGQGQHAIQVELNRALYMDEMTKELKVDAAEEVSQKILRAVSDVVQGLPQLLK